MTNFSQEVIREFEEKGANLEHDRWARWHRYSRLIATPQNIEMWDRKAEMPFIALTEKEQESDRKETRNYIPLLNEALFKQRETMVAKVGKILPDARPTFMIDKGMVSESIDYKKEEDFELGYEKALEDIIREISSL